MARGDFPLLQHTMKIIIVVDLLDVARRSLVQWYPGKTGRIEDYETYINNLYLGSLRRQPLSCPSTNKHSRLRGRDALRSSAQFLTNETHLQIWLIGSAVGDTLIAGTMIYLVRFPPNSFYVVY